MGRELKRVAPGAEYGSHLDEDPPMAEGEWYQMWQTVSDKPYTPAFETPEELARWCADHPWGMEVDNPVSYETWLRFITGPGWAPSLAGFVGEMTLGVEFRASDKVPNINSTT